MRSEGKVGIMKENEVIIGHLNPCVRIFIESLLDTQLTPNVVGDDSATERSDVRKGEKQQAT